MQDPQKVDLGDSGTSNYFNSELAKSLITETLRNQLLDAIEKNKVSHIQELLRKYPALLNEPLNDRRQSALIVATENRLTAVMNVLLEMGVDIQYQDSNDLNALDYASCSYNGSTYQLLTRAFSDPGKLVTLTIKLTEKVQDLIQSGVQDQIKSDLLNAALSQLNRFRLERTNSALLLDLYLTVNSVVNLCQSDLTGEALITAIKKYISLREDFMSGDSQDYSYKLSLANEFCYKIAKIIRPTDLPVDILLHNTMTKDRTPWKNIYTGEDNLPDNPGDFFRSNGKIHLYDGVLEIAIAALRAGHADLNEIWFGTDGKQPLSPAEIRIIQQRTPAFSELVEHTITLNKNVCKYQDSTYNRLCKLRTELEKGDVEHTGTEEEANATAFVAVAEFAEWWNDLGNSAEGKEKQNQIRRIDLIDATDEVGRLGNIIDVILDADPDVDRKEKYCIQIKGNLLNETLEKEATWEALFSIDETINWHASSEQLDKWENTIKEELATLPPNIETDKNIYESLNKSETLVDYMTTHPDFDFLQLINASDIGVDKKVDRSFLESCLTTSNSTLSEFVIKYHTANYPIEELRETVLLLLQKRENDAAKMLLKSNDAIAIDASTQYPLNLAIELVVNGKRPDHELIKLLYGDESISSLRKKITPDKKSENNKKEHISFFKKCKNKIKHGLHKVMPCIRATNS